MPGAIPYHPFMAQGATFRVKRPEPKPVRVTVETTAQRIADESRQIAESEGSK